jgi:hypothetical protein
VLHERIGGFSPPPDDREEIGKFLRRAFPLGLASFEGITSQIEKEVGDAALRTYARTLGGWFPWLRRRGCRHVPVLDFSNWEHSPSGEGFYVSKCKLCGTEMTKPQHGGWQPIALKDRK